MKQTIYRKNKIRDVLKGLAVLAAGGAAAVASIGIVSNNHVHASGVGPDNMFAKTYHFHGSSMHPEGYDKGHKVYPDIFNTDGGQVAFCRQYNDYTPTASATFSRATTLPALHVLEVGWPGQTVSQLGVHDAGGESAYDIARKGTQLAYWQVSQANPGGGAPHFSVADFTPNNAAGREIKAVATKVLQRAKSCDFSKSRPTLKLTPEGNYPKDSFVRTEKFRVDLSGNYQFRGDQAHLHVNGLPKGSQVYVHGQKVGNGDVDKDLTIKNGETINITVPHENANSKYNYKWNMTLSGMTPFLYAANYTAAQRAHQNVTVIKRDGELSASKGNSASNKPVPPPTTTTTTPQKQHPTPTPTITVPKGSLTVTKKDTDGKLMPGTVIGLYRPDQNGGYDYVRSQSTGSDGTCTFSDLDDGPYLVREENTDAEHKTTDTSGNDVQAVTNVNGSGNSSLTLTDQKIADTPHIKSMTAEKGTEKRNLDAKKQDLQDEMDIYHLDAGHSYHVTDTLMDASTGQPAKINGQGVTWDSGQFTAGSSDKGNNGNPSGQGTPGDKVNHQIDATFHNVDFSNLQNHRYYMQAQIYSNTDNNQCVYIERSDIDANQNLYIKNPWATSHLVNKTAENYNDGSAETQNDSYKRDVNPSSNEDLQDTFTEHGLVPGHGYTLTAQLMAKDGSSYKPILDSGAKQTKTFTATDQSANNSVDFKNVDLTKYKRQDVTVYYKLTPSNQTNDNLINYDQPDYFGEDNETLHVTNPKQITVTKLDTSGKVMPHTKFTIYRKDEHGNLQSVKSAETDSNGKLTFDNLEPAKYVIREDTTDKEHENSDSNGYNQEQDVDASDINTTNYYVTFTDAPIEDEPNVESRTTEAGTGSRLLDAKDEDLHDDLDFTRLDGSHHYKAVDTLMDAKTGKPVDKNGDDVDDLSKGASASTEFTAPGRHGEHVNYDTKVALPTVNFAGKQDKDYYTQVRIYNDDGSSSSDGKLLRVEQSHHDVDQDLHVTKPTATTQARSAWDKDDVTGEQHVNPYSKTELVDHAISHNLVPKHQYTIHEWIMEKDGDKVSPFKANGNEVTATKDFTADNESMEEDVDFGKFSTMGVRGKDLVIYYKITPKSEENDKLASLTDKDNQDETINVTRPKLHSVATIDGSKQANPSKFSKIDDRVDYSGVAPNQPMNMDAIAAYRNNKAVMVRDPNGSYSYLMGKTAFKPGNDSGEADVALQEVAAANSGTDATDENEKGEHSGSAPKVNAADKSGKSSLDVSGGLSTASDTAKSDSETADGMGDDAHEGPDISEPSVRRDLNHLSAINDGAAQASPDRTADKADDNLDDNTQKETFKDNDGHSPYDVDTSGLHGQNIHLFEDAYMKDDLEPLASIDSTDDEDETVHVTNPKIYTTALLDQRKVSNPNTKSFLQDKIHYENVAPGHSLTLSTMAMNEKTGQPIVITENGKQFNLMGRKVITPDQPNGNAIVPLQEVQAGTAAKSNQGTNITKANASDVKAENLDSSSLVKNLQTAIGKLDGSSDSSIGSAKTDLQNAVTQMGKYYYDANTGVPTNITDDINKDIKTIGSGKSVDVGDLDDATSALQSDLQDDDGNGSIIPESQYNNWKNQHHDQNGGATATNGTTSASAGQNANSKAAGSSDISSGAAANNFETSSAIMARVNENQLTGDNSDGAADSDADPDDTTGDHSDQYAIDTQSLRGQTMTMFEDMTSPFDNNGTPLTTDANLANTDESVRVTAPEIGTTQKIDGQKSGKSEHDNNLTDTVKFRDFAPGETAHLEAVEMDKNSGKPVDINNNFLVGRETFTPHSDDGIVNVGLQKQNTPPAYQYLVRDLDNNGMPTSKSSADQEQESTESPAKALHMDGDSGGSQKQSNDNRQKPDTSKANNQDQDNEDDDSPDIDEDDDTGKGTVDLTEFERDSQLLGKTLSWTAFETAQTNNGNTIAEHKDIQSPSQTVNVTLKRSPKSPLRSLPQPTPKQKQPKITQVHNSSTPASVQPETHYGEQPAQSHTPSGGGSGATPTIGHSYPQYARTSTYHAKHNVRHTGHRILHHIWHSLKRTGHQVGTKMSNLF